MLRKLDCPVRRTYRCHELLTVGSRSPLTAGHLRTLRYVLLTVLGSMSYRDRWTCYDSTLHHTHRITVRISQRARYRTQRFGDVICYGSSIILLAVPDTAMIYSLCVVVVHRPLDISGIYTTSCSLYLFHCHTETAGHLRTLNYITLSASLCAYTFAAVPL